MHAIHHTDAVILKSVSSGEANKRVWLFTESFGLVVATVQGVRKGGAKLQAQVRDYAFVSADLVKGRDIWRLVSARVLDEPLAGKLREPIARAYVRTLSLLVRFLIDEGPHPELFAHVQECRAVIKEEVDARNFDAFSIWKMLVLLGYIAPDLQGSILLEKPFSEALAEVTDTLRMKLVKESEEAIAQSQL